MKVQTLFIFLVLFNTSAMAQSMNLCDSVSMYNSLGGLDCALVSTAPYTADSYQWVNCDDSFSIFPGDTTDYFSTLYYGNVALIVTVGACVDTSYCEYHCHWGLDELNSNDKKLVRVVDHLGRDTQDEPFKLLIYIYSDGTTKKVFTVE